jgi:signal transduction histidine kinase
VGRSPLDFVAVESRPEVERRISEGIDGTYELVLLRKDGRRALCEATGKAHLVDGRQGRVTALRDVTETRELEAQLRQAQKLDAVGQLAGGLAHDFNNVLTVILTEAQLLGLSEEAGRNDELADSLHEIEIAGKRAAALTRQLLTFARRDVVELEIVDPREVAEGLSKMLSRLIGEDVRMDVSFEESVGSVRIDRGQLEQVIVNLVVNARDAMPEGGDVSIEITGVVLDEEYARTHGDCTPGHYVLIAVSDTGVGMSPEVRERLFEPFFTTKPVGKGTGLGLATSYGIVNDRGGHIGVYSEVGVGTTMKVYLPVVEEAPVSDRQAPQEPAAHVPSTGTVLVVEDDDAVRRNAVRALKLMGYRVLSASNGSAALAALEDEGGRVDLLFTDVVMPGMSGPDLVSKVKELSPLLKVLYTTGYTADMALRHRLLDQFDSVLPKPYTPEGLSRKVRELLGA